MKDCKIRVVVAAARNSIRAGFTTMLSRNSAISVVGQAADGVEAMEHARNLKPHVILLEPYVPCSNGLETTSSIKQASPDTKVLTILDAEREDEVQTALARGASGYVLVSCSNADLVHSVKRVSSGDLVLSPGMASALTTRLRNKAARPPLSAREDEVLNLLGEGLSNREIAERLYVSESSVRTYVNRLEEKLHLGTRNRTVAYAARHRPAEETTANVRGEIGPARS